MENIDIRVAEYLKRSRRKNIWKQVVKTMSCVVVFCTVYALILPAITAQTPVFCGVEEHAHTEDCYVQTSASQPSQLLCSSENLEVHVHQDSCYDTEGNCICGQADFVVHSHNELCYDPDGNLICSLEERSQHVHDESCYRVLEPETQPTEPAVETQPVQTEPTIPEHVHTEECYQVERGALICTQEGVEEHTHGEDCYVPGENRICNQEETEGHVHGAECTVQNLLCGSAAAEIHEHSAECYQSHQICTLAETEGHAHGDSCWGRNQICGLEENEEHTHGDGCYESVLLCRMTETEPHTHGDTCFEQVLTCQVAAIEEHIHDDSCYQTTVICEKEEQEPHSHNDECYEPVLECQVHLHTDECYEKVEKLICPESQIPETEPTELPQPQPTEAPAETEPELVLICTEPVAQEHVHSEACFPVTEPELTCTLEENEEHTHSALCYGTWELTCEVEEHTHATACYADPTADLETAADWEETFSRVEFTGNWAEDTLAIARTQLGYTESEKNYIVTEDGTIYGYTRYGEWYGDAYGDWCAMFVSFCLNYAEVENMPLESSCSKWIQALKAMSLYQDDPSYQPKPADVIFFDWERDGVVDHVGLVHELIPASAGEKARIQTIEGNSANCVQYVTYPADDARIFGYGLLPERQIETYPCGLEAHSHENSCYDNGSLICQKPEHTHGPDCTERKLYYADDTLTAYVTISNVESLPEGLTLRVWRLNPEEDPALYSSMEVAVSAEMSTDSRFVSSTAIFQTELLLDGEPYTLPEDAKVDVEVKFDDPVFTKQDVKEAVDMQTYVVTPDPEAEIPEEEVEQEEETTEPMDQEQEDPFSLGNGGGEAPSINNAPEETEPVTEGTNTEVYQAEVPEEEKIENPDQGVTGVTIKANRLGAVAVALASDIQEGEFWTRVKNTSELSSGGTFMIVSAEGNYALTGTNGTNNNYAAVTIQTVKGNVEYYTISNTAANLRWTFSGSGSSYTIRNQGTNNYLQLSGTTFINSSSASTTVTYYTPENCWRLYYVDEGLFSDTNYYLKNGGTGSFSRASGNDAKTSGTLGSDVNHYYKADMLIFKLSDVKSLEVPKDVTVNNESGGSALVAPNKPNYGSFITPTGSLTGVTAVTDPEDSTITVAGQYFSDPSTTDIENEFREGNFEENKQNDGKVLSDKSVIYGDDDYGAFDTYPANTFGVTLSALGQEYELPQQDSVVTPVDVVFVLDVSGSMSTNYTENDGELRIQALEKGFNDAMTKFLDKHPANRVGVSIYSTGAWELLPLDRYTANDSDGDGVREYVKLEGETLPYGGSTKYFVVGSDSLKSESTGKSYAGVGSYGGAGNAQKLYQGIGTYPQAGLAIGKDIFHNIGDDTKYTTTIGQGEYQREITVTRQPVIVLLSDGEPTHCTNIYMDALNGPHYGDGNGDLGVGNVSGIQGYYTILTANYVKRMVGIHYQKPALFYTIGMGIKKPGDQDNDTPYASTSTTSKPGTGDRYKRAVLDPDPATIASLTTSINSDDTVVLLRNLLNGTADVQAVETRSQWPDPWLGVPHIYTPVLDTNPYASNYDYADEAFFGKMSTEELEEIFDKILTQSQQDTPYGFILYKSSSVEIQDNVGEGMEVKGTPVLRYGGRNYSNPTVRTSGNTTTYTYSGTFTDPYIPDRTINLAQIQVSITTDANGNQIVDMFVPDTALPTYTPELIGKQFYYESLPVRLIYQVGLTEESEQAVLDLQKTGGELVFYTNRWQTPDDVAFSTLLPSEANPFYYDVDKDGVTPPYQPHHTDKSENTTLTEGYVVDCNKTTESMDGKNIIKVIHKLGNNGKLVFKADTVSIPVEKKWEGVASSDQTDVTVTLYKVVENTTEAGVTDRQVTMVQEAVISASTNWKYTFEGLAVPGENWYYAIVESLVPGTQPQYSGQTVSISVDNGAPVLAAKVDFTVDPLLVTITNVPGVELPSTGGAGTTLYTTGGLLIMAISAVLLLYSNKTKRRKEDPIS